MRFEQRPNTTGPQHQEKLSGLTLPGRHWRNPSLPPKVRYDLYRENTLQKLDSLAERFKKATDDERSRIVASPEAAQLKKLSETLAAMTRSVGNLDSRLR